MPSTWPAFAQAIAQSLCAAPLAIFTIQHAGSTTSPTIERAPTFTGSASLDALADVAVAAFAAVAGLAAAAAGVAGLAAVAAGAAFGVAVGVPEVADCANAAAARDIMNAAGTNAAKTLRVFIQSSISCLNFGGERDSLVGSLPKGSLPYNPRSSIVA